ncbi:cytochrome c [bacterium]|nr:cytochrome c [bacterium]
MPPMANLLKHEELRDLTAWLVSLDHGGDAPKPAAEPTPLDPATLDLPKKSATPVAAGIDPAFMKTGQQQFLVCGACHGQNGEGTAAAPPLAGSEWVTGPAENLIRIQLRGLQGPIRVKGQEYNMPGGMAALAYQNDEQIAAVLTYVRNSFGNSAPPIAAAAVAALRGEVGKPQISAADLVAPVPTAPPTPIAKSATPGKYDHLTPESALPKKLALAALLGSLGLFAWMARKK